MNQIVKYNKPRAGSGAVSASGAAVALSSLAGVLTEAQLSVILEGYLLKETFDDLFVKESDGKGGYRIKAKYALYSNQYISCLGANPDAGAVALGATTLGGLNNVVAAADEVSAAAKVLVREAGAASWSLKNLSDIVGLDTAALSTYLSNNHYATQQWVRLQGYLTEHQSLADYAKKTWVQAQGYLTAITKAQVEAVLTGDITTHTHSQYLTSTLASQTYQPIGDYATNSALNSAVSSLNTAIGKKLDAATFDDLFVKESDGNGGYRIRAKYAFYSNQYISCLGNNPGAGTSPGGGVDLDAVAEYLQQQGYATQDWVRVQGYLASGALAPYLKIDGTNGTHAGVSALIGKLSDATANVLDSTKFVTSDNGGDATSKLYYRRPASALWNYIKGKADGVYVTVDTEQEIPGKKTFTAAETAVNRRLYVNGSFDTFDNYPHYMWHVAGSRWTKAVMDTNGHIHFVDGGASGFTSYKSIKALAFVVSGGTSSQILLADGSVGDELAYMRYRGATSTAGESTLWSQIGVKSYQNALPDGLSGVYKYGEAISFASGSARFDMYVNHFSSSGQYDGRGIYYRSGWNTDKRLWQLLLDSNNYSSVLDSRYVRSSATRELLWEWGNTTPTHVWGAKGGDASKAYVFSGENIRNFANAVCRAGDTMTGVLNIAHNSTNNVIKTQYNTAGDYTNVIFATVDNSRVIFGSPAWATVELETAGAAVWRRTAGTTYKIWDAGNDGSGSGLDADLLDGCHETSFVRSWWTASPGYNCATYNTRPLISFTYGNNAPFTGAFIDIVTGGYGFMLGTVYNSDAPLYYRRHGISRDGGLGAWQQLARIGDNVASATRLQGTYSLWGQSFYGNNVSGNMSGVGTINSAAAPINTIYASDWYRSIGATGWYNQTYGGGWHMDNASWIKSWNKPVYIAYAAGEGPNSFGVGLRCYHASHTSVEVQGGSYTMGLGCHNNGSWYWWRGTSSSKYYVMQYDGTTWNFTGVLKTSTGMYSDGYMSCLGKNDGSDERLKSIIEDVTLPIDVILAAPAKRFAWNANAGAVMAGKVAVGTLAQYWLEHLTEVVGTMPTGYYGVNYGALDWVAIHSVARYAYDGLTEHERRILALETENKALKSKINELERRVAA